MEPQDPPVDSPELSQRASLFSRSPLSDHHLTHRPSLADLPGSYPYSESARTSNQPSPPPSTALETLFAFPLLRLPPEVILTVIAHVDERDPSPTFPTGPCTELLRLSETSRWFHQECRARIWRSIAYVSESRYRPLEFRRARSLATLRDIIRTRRAQGIQLPILALSLAELVPDDFTHMTGPDEEEQAMLAVVSDLAGSTLQVLFLRQIEMSRAGAQRLLEAIQTSPTLSALRFNQIDFWPDHPDMVRSFAPLTRIKTIQVMHSDPELFQLVDKCPNLDSLLLWPATRRLGNRIHVVKGLLPHLRLLSLDSVREATAFRALADEIIVRRPLSLSLCPSGRLSFVR